MQHVDTKTEIARLAASGAVVTIAGMTLNEWVAIFTIVYLLIQTVIITPKAFMIVRGWVLHISRYFKEKKNAKKDRSNE